MAYLRLTDNKTEPTYFNFIESHQLKMDFMKVIVFYVHKNKNPLACSADLKPDAQIDSTL